MTRYRHYLQPTVRHTFPAHILCVDCVGRSDVVQQTASKQVEELVSWHTILLSLKEQRYGIVASASGSKSAYFWSELMKLLATSGSVWIVSQKCVRQWSLLGLWQELENDRWTLTGYDNRTEDARRDAVRRMQLSSDDPLRQPATAVVRDMLHAADGYLCIEDTPNILRVRPTDSERMLTWVDVRNYGVDVPATAANGSSHTRWIADFIQRYTSTLYAYNLGSLKATVASQAMGGFKHGYLRAAIYSHTCQQSLGTERSGYVGGRCECFRLGRVSSVLYHADFRSAYGAVQRDCALPVRLAGRVSNPGHTEAERYCASYGAIATVDIETDEEAYPYRRGVPESTARRDTPSADESSGWRADTDIIYPIGRFTTTLCGPELQDALERGRVKRWHELCYYDMEPALRDYANAIYQLRCDSEGSGDRDIAAVAKRLLVSLPGKLGQRDRRWIYCPTMHGNPEYGEWWGSNQRGEPCRYRAIAGKVYRDEIGDWSVDAVPSIAAWITSAARVKLLGAIRCATWEHTYYVDTDSLMVDEFGWTNLQVAGLVNDRQLGYLYLKGTSDTTIIYGIKHYVEDGKLVCAGLPKDQCADYGDGKHYWYQLSAKDQIRSKQAPEAARVLKVYDRGGKYRHRLVGEDGRTTPIVLRDW